MRVEKKIQANLFEHPLDLPFAIHPGKNALSFLVLSCRRDLKYQLWLCQKLCCMWRELRRQITVI